MFKPITAQKRWYTVEYTLDKDGKRIGKTWVLARSLMSARRKAIKLIVNMGGSHEVKKVYERK